jgi:hypothetical protein
VKKCHDLGHLSFSLNKVNQINMKDYIRMLHTKFGDHPSNILVGDDVQMFSIFSFSGPFKGPIKLI